MMTGEEEDRIGDHGQDPVLPSSWFFQARNGDGKLTLYGI